MAARKRRKWTPICPRPGCGSVRVGEVADGRLHCLDCGHTAAPHKFDQSSPHGGTPSSHWRDGAALSMDGIEG